MKNIFGIAAAVLLSLPLLSGAQQKSTTEDVVRAANNFLATLTSDQREKVLYQFDDATQRARWSNFPTGFVAWRHQPKANERSATGSRDEVAWHRPQPNGGREGKRNSAG
jgi:hypothetical protein